jgi:hypothetical protein
MLYAALGFWLAIAVLSAWGVHGLWSGLVKPRVVNMVLLPGTLVAQMGHVLGLLVTGGTVNNTTLIKDDETGAPEQTPDPKPRIPIVGPVLVGLLPLLLCAVAIFFAAKHLGGPAVKDMTFHEVKQSLPVSMPSFWQLMRDHITVMEQTFGAATRIDASSWKPIIFLYLLVCLSVRMAPFPGNLRGSLGAIVVVSLLAALFAAITPKTDTWIRDGWSVLSLAVATLSLLLLFTTLVYGGVALVRLLMKNA